MFEKLFGKREKIDKNQPRIVEIKKAKDIKKYGGSKKLIAPYTSYADVMRMIPEGKLITKEIIRVYLAKKYGADFTDTLTSEIFINLAAGESDNKKIAEVPYWRTLELDGRINEKFPGGVEKQRLLLEKEGHIIIEKGKFYYVKGFEKKIFHNLLK